MSAAKKAIWFAVGFILMIGVIYISINFYNKSTSMTKTADTSLNDISQKISASKYAEFDNQKVSGSQVLSAISTFASTTPVFTVTVTTKLSTVAYTNPSGYNITDISLPGYIEPTANFSAVLGKTSNGTVNAITVTQQ